MFYDNPIKLVVFHDWPPTTHDKKHKPPNFFFLQNKCDITQKPVYWEVFLICISICINFPWQNPLNSIITHSSQYILASIINKKYLTKELHTNQDIQWTNYLDTKVGQHLTVNPQSIKRQNALKKFYFHWLSLSWHGDLWLYSIVVDIEIILSGQKVTTLSLILNPMTVFCLRFFLSIFWG